MLNAYNPKSFSAFPQVVKNLLILNGLFFMATIIVQSRFRIDLTDTLGLYYFSSEFFKPWQLVTHLFMHANIAHIFFNMFALWMFGSTLENIWGPKRFLIYYMFTGIGASLLHNGVIAVELYKLVGVVDAYSQNPNLDSFNLLINEYAPRMENSPFMKLSAAWQEYPNDPLYIQTSIDYAAQLVRWKENSSAIGASGAVFGILMAYGMLLPNTELMLIFFPVPIKAKYLVTFYGLAELYRGFANDPTDKVAHFAHLGGMLFGFILIKYWNKTNRKTLY